MRRHLHSFGRQKGIRIDFSSLSFSYCNDLFKGYKAITLGRDKKKKLEKAFFGTL